MVQGTPACGKSVLLSLIANELMSRERLNGMRRKIHILNGWARFLEVQTGVKGYDWPTSNSYLLFDESQQSYWDSTLWSSFFKAMIHIGGSYCPTVILFASYGSTRRGNSGIDATKYFQTPVQLGPDQIIPMREEEISDSELGAMGILLNHHDSRDVTERYSLTVGNVRVSNELVEHLYQVTGGHAGCLSALLKLFSDKKEFDDLRKKSGVFELCLVQEKLFNCPQRLFRYLKNTQFARGLPNMEVLQTQPLSSIFKKAVGSGSIDARQFQSPAEMQALEDIWRNGWLEGTNNNHEYWFASFIHQW